MTTPRGALIALLAAASLALPATASAAVRHVSKAGVDNASCSVASPCLTIGHAVSVANADDTIRIGPGSYDEAVVADDPLHFDGAGAGSPDSLITPGTTRIQPLSVDGPAIEMH